MAKYVDLVNMPFPSKILGLTHNQGHELVGLFLVALVCSLWCLGRGREGIEWRRGWWVLGENG